VSLFTNRTADVEDAEEVAVVAMVTGDKGNATYARQLREQENDLEETLRAEGEGADVKETTITELDEETKRQLEAQIEDLIIPDTLEEVISTEKDDDDMSERKGDGETSGEQELTEDAVAEEANDEETADKDDATSAEGRIAACISAITSSFV